MLNSEQTKEIFDKESILIGTRNVIPLYKAEKILGSEAAQFADSFGTIESKGQYSNCFCTNSGCLKYLTYNGFQIAVTYKNIDDIQKAGVKI